MTVEEFHQHRRPFYIDLNTGLVKFPSSKHMDTSHAEWFTDMGYQWCSVVRGYFWETENNVDDHVCIYTNNFNIPGVNIDILTYIFEHFLTVKWIGLGCYIGKPGEKWEPQLKVYKN
jgi:hypothetical protein